MVIRVSPIPSFGRQTSLRELGMPDLEPVFRNEELIATDTSLALRVEDFFNEDEKADFYKIREELDLKEQNLEITFPYTLALENKQKIKNRMAFELVYLKVKPNLKQFKISWANGYRTPSYGKGAMIRDEAFRYEGSLNERHYGENKRYTVDALEATIDKECRHFAQHYLRDTLGLEKYQLLFVRNKVAFAELPEHINEPLYYPSNNYEEKKLMSYVNFGGVAEAHLLAAPVSAGILTKLEPLKKSPKLFEYIRAYSILFTLMDFSSVGLKDFKSGMKVPHKMVTPAKSDVEIREDNFFKDQTDYILSLPVDESLIKLADEALKKGSYCYAEKNEIAKTTSLFWRCLRLGF